VTEQDTTSRPQFDDDLARAAGEIINAVSHDENPKFKNSQFLGLMRQLRDHDVVVEGNDMVHASEASKATNLPVTDAKGKGKAVEFAHPPATIPTSGPGETVGQQRSPYDPNEAYFGSENEEYADYWSAHHSVRDRQPPPDNQGWAALQESWDSWEATSAGVRPALSSGYNFQTSNPYLVGERTHSPTHHHSIHDARLHSFLEVRDFLVHPPHD